MGRGGLSVKASKTLRHCVPICAVQFMTVRTNQNSRGTNPAYGHATLYGFLILIERLYRETATPHRHLSFKNPRPLEISFANISFSLKEDSDSREEKACIWTLTQGYMPMDDSFHHVDHFFGDIGGMIGDTFQMS